jgi:hypothetical protein
VRKQKLKKLPVLRTDRQAEAGVDNAEFATMILQRSSPCSSSSKKMRADQYAPAGTIARSRQAKR